MDSSTIWYIVCRCCCTITIVIDYGHVTILFGFIPTITTTTSNMAIISPTLEHPTTLCPVRLIVELCLIDQNSRRGAAYCTLTEYRL